MTGAAAAGRMGSRMDQGEFSLSGREFARIKARIYKVAGISLSDAKRTLVISRLSKILRALHLPSFDAYVDYLEGAGTVQDSQDFINALTTNLTRFYREDHHFEHLRAYVGQLLAEKPRGTRLRIWSAGCSTGQEAYTIGMDLLAAHAELARWDFRILATDIDTAVIHKAARGVYPASEVAGLPPERARPFERRPDGTVRIPAPVRERIAFKPFNLMEPVWPMRGPFDAIFCRNVVIYFDQPTKQRLFRRYAQLLPVGGHLFLGHSESLHGVNDDFELIGRTVYRKRG